MHSSSESANPNLIELKLKSQKLRPRFLEKNPHSGLWHLYVPISSGESINLDNTCQTVLALQEFFGKRSDSATSQKSGLDELRKFRRALDDDRELLLSVLDSSSPSSTDTIQSIFSDIEQIDYYIRKLEDLSADQDLTRALSGVFPTYPTQVTDLLRQPSSNILSMQLRPRSQDQYLRIPNPVFQVNRSGLSNLYVSLQRIFIPQINRIPNNTQLIEQAVRDMTPVVNQHLIGTT